MNVTVFEAINITKKYRNTLALNQVSMSVMQGDIYGFIGENGAGKTTMIRLLILLMFVKDFFLEVAQKKGRTKRTHQIAGFEKMM